MPRVKFHILALGLCLLFAAFSIGYFFGVRPRAGTYEIRTEHAPNEQTAALTPEPAAPSATPAAVPSEGPAADLRIDINTASAEELTDLPGIGPALAARIVAYRAEHGPFPTPDALTEVSGIGAKTLETLRPYIKTGNVTN
jgi:competence protein ComEA